ncbi:MAG: hypothetical protein ACRDT4_09425, partial [Micromonosporaceae bacterium]
ERLTARRTPRWVPFAVAAGVVVLTAGIGAAVVMSNGADRPAPPAATGLDAEVVRDGDRVTATGNLVWAPGKPILLCQVNPAILISPAPAPTCSPWAVEVPEPAVGGVSWKQTDRVRHTEERYTVSGTWRDGRIAQPSLAQAPTGSDEPLGDGTAATEELPLPCDPPEGGWVQPRVDPAQLEAARSALSEQVTAHPASYSGLWVAEGNGVDVMVVGTVHAPAEHQRKLAATYPYPLCVTKADYSAAQLNATADRLATGDGSWMTAVLPQHARVEVQLFVLDDAARDRIGKDAGMVTVLPFVHRE